MSRLFPPHVNKAPIYHALVCATEGLQHVLQPGACKPSITLIIWLVQFTSGCYGVPVPSEPATLPRCLPQTSADTSW